jgi:hypothetical protein
MRAYRRAIAERSRPRARPMEALLVAVLMALRKRLQLFEILGFIFTADAKEVDAVVGLEEKRELTDHAMRLLKGD